jgi:hypothetical protein
MPEFTLHRNYLLRTTKGHSVRFVKGKPSNVPPRCVEDALAIGAVPTDPKEGDILEDAPKAAPSMSADERRAKVFEAFGIMKMRGERQDFTASNAPNTKRLPALVGFEVTRKERDSYWRDFQAQEQENADQAALDRRTAQAEAADS